MFSQLKALLQAGDTAGALSVVANLESNYNTLSLEVKNLETKVLDITQSREKYKNVSKTFKQKLGFDDTEELSEENINTKISSIKSSVKTEQSEIEKQLKTEISNLENQFSIVKTEYETKLTTAQKDALEKKLELELFKNTSGVKSVNAKAHSLIMQELKQSLTFDENGMLIYKNQDGSIDRKNGVAKTVKDKLDEIQSSEDFSFLFSKDVKSGSGFTNTKNKITGGATSTISNTLKQRALEKGIKFDF